jgi:hypothetical protein
MRADGILFIAPFDNISTGSEKIIELFDVKPALFA